MRKKTKRRPNSNLNRCPCNLHSLGEETTELEIPSSVAFSSFHSPVAGSPSRFGWTARLRNVNCEVLNLWPTKVNHKWKKSSVDAGERREIAKLEVGTVTQLQTSKTSMVPDSCETSFGLSCRRLGDFRNCVVATYMSVWGGRTDFCFTYSLELMVKKKIMRSNCS